MAETPDDRIIAYIRDYFAEHQYPPTIREIAAELDMAVGAIHRRLARMHTSGRITMQPLSPRTITIVDNDA